MHGFETVKNELDAKRIQLEHELDAARGKMDEIQADLDRVHEALGALTGHKKKAKSRSASRKKPATSVQDLQRHIARVRQQNPFADANELYEAVRAHVRESGASLAGYKTLFAEALVSSPGSDEGASSHGAHHRAPTGAPSLASDAGRFPA